MVHPSVIGLISHAPRSGKSTVANVLASAHGGMHRIIPFSAPLKRAAESILLSLGLSPQTAKDHLYFDKESEIPRLGCSGRYLLQTLGTEWGRKMIHSDIWLNCWQHEVDSSLLEGTPVVTDDVRFRNEGDLIRLKFGGELWLVRRPGVENPYQHESEGAFAGEPDSFYDRVIENNGTITDLWNQLSA